jgi:hypothetical protein
MRAHAKPPHRYSVDCATVVLWSTWTCSPLASLSLPSKENIFPSSASLHSPSRPCACSTVAAHAVDVSLYQAIGVEIQFRHELVTSRACCCLTSVTLLQSSVSQAQRQRPADAAVSVRSKPLSAPLVLALSHFLSGSPAIPSGDIM